MRLVVFGASGPTGLRVVAQALAAGHAVVAVTRRPSKFPVQAPALIAAGADVEDAVAVARAMTGSDAVISTFGVPYGRKPIRVYSSGIRNILAAMEEHSVQRLVCVSSTTLAEPLPGDTLFWRRIVVPLLRRVIGRTLYDDMARMEALVRVSGAKWTIVRPGGLFDSDAPTDTVTVAAHRLKGRYTSRADLAEVLIREATERPSHPGMTIEAISRSGPASPLRTFWKEAFGDK